MKKIKYILALLVVPFLGFNFNTSVYADSVHTWSKTITTTTDTLNNSTNCNTAPNVYDLTELGFDGSFVPTNVTITFDGIGTAPMKIYFSNNILDTNCFNDSYQSSLLKFEHFNSGTLSSKSFSLPYLSAYTDLRFGIRYNGATAGNITFVFSDSDGCPEPEPCPTCPDCSDASRFIQIVIDAFWKYHIAFAGVVVPLIAIFLVYRLLKGRLR